MLLCHVEESEVQAVSNILSVSYLCLFCVSEGVVSRAEYRGAHEGGRGAGGSYTYRFERMQKIEEGRQRARVTVF